MPRHVRLHPDYEKTVKIATEAELLDFANKLRVAGDADPLEALMPSTPGGAFKCLIANACNFSSSVTPRGNTDEDSGAFDAWKLTFPENMDAKRAQRVADAVGCELTHEYGSYGRFCLILPEEIGNAAHAFDEGAAFTKYVSATDDED